METYGIADAARSLGVKPSAVRKAITRGVLVATGTPPVVDGAELERYREENLMRRGDRTEEIAAYNAVVALADAGLPTPTVRRALAPGVEESARAYATRRRLRWPLKGE